MKSYQDILEMLSEAKGKWVRPSDANISQEYKVEYQKHLKPRLGKDIFPTERDFVIAVKKSPTVVVDAAMDRKIGNRSRTQSMKSLLGLISGYRSYPKFRNEDTLKALSDRIKKGLPVDMPIVVKMPDGDMRIMAGNTRMDIAFMHGVNPTVVMLDLKPYLKSVE